MTKNQTVKEFADEAKNGDPEADKPAAGDGGEELKSNSPAAKRVEQIIPDLISQQIKVDAIMERARKECEPIRQAMAAQKKEVASETGVSVKVINVKYAEAKYEMDHQKKLAQLGDDHQFEYDQFTAVPKYDVEKKQLKMVF